MGWVGALIVVEDNVLFLARACNNLAGTSLELSLDLSEDGQDVGGKETKDKDSDLALDLFNSIIL